MVSEKLRIGYISGQAKRLNERVIDSQWVNFLGQYVQLVPISPHQVFKLFGGTFDRWIEELPQSIEQLGEGLEGLTKKHGIHTLYMNVPFLLPYLMMARNYAGLDLGFLFLTHSVGSEKWLRYWIGVAPTITERDVMLVSTCSSREALLQISPKFEAANLVPLCMEMRDTKHIHSMITQRKGKHLLSIGRIEDVKNIGLLLEVFSSILPQIPDLRLTIAGEYTGYNAEQIASYMLKLNRIVEVNRLEGNVIFSGPVDGEAKEQLFRSADVLINLSTDPGETFGFNLIEAKTWAMPVICVDWNGFREVVSHEKDGFLIDCDWEEDVPVINKNQAVKSILHLLLNESLRKKMSDFSLQSAATYDYKRVFPIILQALRQAEQSVSVRPDNFLMQTFQQKLSHLSGLYNLDNMRQLPFYEQSLMAIMSGESSMPLGQWMPKSKPIIQHYAGGLPYAKC